MKLIDDLKDYLALKGIKKVLAFQNRNTHYPDFKSVKTVLILFKSDEREKNVFIRKIISDLKNQGKKVTAWGYIDKKEPITAVLPEFRLFGNDELGFSNLPKKILTEEFQINEYDMVIHLCLSDVFALDYLLAQARSPFKVSTTKPYKGIADFMIGLNEADDEAYLFKQMMHYLTSIQAKK